MAFSAELEADYPDRVFISAADERDADPDLRAIVTVPGAEVYCCGPEALMSAVAVHVPKASFHLERFVAVERAAKTNSARSARSTATSGCTSARRATLTSMPLALKCADRSASEYSRASARLERMRRCTPRVAPSARDKSSRNEGDYSNKLLSAMRFGFGGHVEPPK